MGHRRKPRDAASEARFEPGCRPPDVEQDLLHDFLGLGGIADHLAHDTEHPAGCLVVDGFVGAFVPERYGGQEVIEPLASAASRDWASRDWASRPPAVLPCSPLGPAPPSSSSPAAV